ncbi:hypothetical protein BGX20_010809, partial [Mortierella sp. AD010]
HEDGVDEEDATGEAGDARYGEDALYEEGEEVVVGEEADGQHEDGEEGARYKEEEAVVVDAHDRDYARDDDRRDDTRLSDDGDHNHVSLLKRHCVDLLTIAVLQLPDAYDLEASFG